MKEIGFKKIKIWYQEQSMRFDTFDEMFSVLFGFPNIKKMLETLEQEKFSKVKQDARELYEKTFGENAIEPVLTDVMIITAEK